MIINAKQALELNDYSMEVWENRLKVARYVYANLSDPDIEAVINYGGDRDCSVCNMYFDMLQRVWESATPFRDSCSSGYHSDMKFLSDYILGLHGGKIDLQLKQKKQQVQELQKEIDALSIEIEDVGG